MVHHQQNIEGRLNNIQTTNTQEDDQLNDIEAEANLKGTMTFRNWTDSLQEKKKVKDPFGLNAYALELARGLEESFIENVIPKKDEKAAPYGSGYKKINEGMYDKLTNYLSKIAFESIKDGYEVGNKVVDLMFVVGPKEEDPDIVSDQFEFDFHIQATFTDDTYTVNGGANPGFDKKGDPIQPLINVNFEIPKNPKWSKVSMDLKDVVRHELEHLTQDGENVRPGKFKGDDQTLRDMIDADLLPKADYFKLEKEIDAMMQGLYFKAKKSKRPYREVIDDYLATQPITQEEKEEILNLWRSRRKALSLPLFENEQVMDYEIYSDMDGVLTDFDAAFEKVSGGIHPRTYETKYGKDKFWEIVDAKGVGYWVGMPWMPDGKQYWDYIKEYKPILLSSPSRSETSRLGKRLWVRNQLPGTKLILAQAKDKQNYARKNRILIDDRKSNIDEWRAQGGIGILHTSAADTIRQLKELGL